MDKRHYCLIYKTISRIKRWTRGQVDRLQSEIHRHSSWNIWSIQVSFCVSDHYLIIVISLSMSHHSIPLYSTWVSLGLNSLERNNMSCGVRFDHFWERAAGHSILNRTVIRIYCPWTRAREENEFGHSFYSATNWEWMRRNLLVKGRLADGAVLSGKLIKYVTALID